MFKTDLQSDPASDRLNLAGSGLLWPLVRLFVHPAAPAACFCACGPPVSVPAADPDLWPCFRFGSDLFPDPGGGSPAGWHLSGLRLSSG